jgi:hypothetical protein
LSPIAGVRAGYAAIICVMVFRPLRDERLFEAKAPDR